MRTALTTALCCLGAASSADAATPGVHVDPHSPGGVEYAVPLDQARHDAAGGPSSSGGSTGSNGGDQLFGVGVGASPPSGAAGNPHSAHGTGSRPGHSAHRANTATGAGSNRSSAGAPAGLSLATANPQAGIQAPLLVAGGSAAIVLAGVALGLTLRRRRVSGPSL